MLAVGFSFLSFFRRITSLPTRIVFPTVFVLCVVGSFAIRNSLFDVYVMMSFGVVGYAMRRLLMPISPLLIGFILGRPFEEAFRQALVSSEGDLGIFLLRPVAAGFLILTLISVGLTIYRRLKRGVEHD
jgi:putative tricarboxylic transport membrane protein